MWASTCSTRPVTGLEMTIEPCRTRNISSPTSPSRNSTCPRLSARSRRLAPSTLNSGTATSLNRRTSRRKATVSAGLATAPAARLGGHATDESAVESLRALRRRGLAEPGQGAEHRAALGLVELVLSQDLVGRLLQLGEEVRVDHCSSDQLGKARHSVPIIPDANQRKKAPPSATRPQASVGQTPANPSAPVERCTRQGFARAQPRGGWLCGGYGSWPC